MRAWKEALASSGARMRREEFNILEFSPDQPDEMGLWPKGASTPLRVLGNERIGGRH